MRLKSTSIYGLLRKFYFRAKRQFLPTPNYNKVHLGCGNIYLKEYINIDISSNSVADILYDIKKIKNLFYNNSLEEILMIHSLNYLRLWEARDFFQDCFKLLKKGGMLVLEFPDVNKCARVIVNSYEQNENEYIEALRAIFAFDLEQIKEREKFMTYRFGWSSWHIEKELLNLGFSKVKILDPESHEKRIWRDIRIEAIK